MGGVGVGAVRCSDQGVIAAAITSGFGQRKRPRSSVGPHLAMAAVMSNSLSTATPAMTRGTMPFRTDDTRNLHQQALTKVISDDSKPQEVRDRAAKSLRAAKMHDAVLDVSESVIGEGATEFLSWPSRVVAGWFKEHPDVSNADIARRANAYLAE